MHIQYELCVEDAYSFSPLLFALVVAQLDLNLNLDNKLLLKISLKGYKV